MTLLGRRTARYLGLVLAVFVAGMLAAVLNVAARRGYGAGDLQAFATWLVPLALIVPRAAAGFAEWSAPWPAVPRLIVATGIGALLGAVWSFAIAAALGPWFGAFSFQVAYCFMVAGVAGMAAPLVASVWR